MTNYCTVGERLVNRFSSTREWASHVGSRVGDWPGALANCRQKTACLTRKHSAMRQAGSLPPVRPVTIDEVEAKFSIGVVKCFVQRKRTGLRVEFDQVQAGIPGTAGSDDKPSGFWVPCRPMRTIVAGQCESCHLGGLLPVGDVEHDEAVNIWCAFNQIVPHDGRNSAPVTGKCVHQLGVWLVRIDAGDALEARS